MEQPLAKIDPAILALMHGSFGKDGALKPFAREIMLSEFQIAGIIPRDAQTVEPDLVPGALLPLKREPENPHDPLAIMVFSEAGYHLGYVPRAKSEVLARLLDVGKLLFAKLESKSWQGDFLKVAVHIYLRDF
jgi:hypothetical protein